MSKQIPTAQTPSAQATPALLRLLGGAALVAVTGVNPALAMDVVRLGAAGTGIVPGTGSGVTIGAPTSTGAGLASGPGAMAPTKLTLGLATLSGEYQDYRRSAATAAPAGPFASTKTLARLVGETVLIDAVAVDDAETLWADLEALGAEVTGAAGRLVSARMPLSELPALEGLATLKLARPALAVTRTGAVTSQGDAAQHSDLGRADFGVDGTGSTVGILSDSFNCLGGYAADVGTGDLPAGVNNLSDIASGCTDEGRAMAQIVHDVAPGAGLAFHTAWNGEADFAQGILDLAAAGSTIIVDDVIYFAEPMFQDGVIAQAADAVKAVGIPYFSAAGNNGREAYEADFSGSGQTGPGGGELHDFDPGPGVDTRLTIQQAANTTYVMQWQDRYASVSGAPGAGTDLAICFYFPVGAPSPIACTTDVNSGGDPIDGLSLNGAGTLEIAIERRSGPAPSPVKVVAFGDIGFVETYAGTAAGTLYGHANAAGAIAVGAAAFYRTPAFGIDPPQLNSYSSAGNTPILFDTAGHPVAQIRHKPELTAPDGGNNTFFGSDSAADADAWPNFFGTSAAAPHAAGVAALMRQVSPGLMPARITRLLQVTAVDILARNTGETVGAGFDRDSGAGLIHARDALAAIGPDLIGVWRPTSRRFLLDSNGSNTWDGTAGGDTLTASFGLNTDLPVTGDWNGDGKDEIGVWRPSTRRFLLDTNGNDTWDTDAGGDTLTGRFGLSTDIPVTGDWNGDGRDDVGVWRPTTRKFLLDTNGNGVWDGVLGGDTMTVAFGLDTDLPVIGDWNGDGTDEIGVWRPSTGKFLLDTSGNRRWDGVAGGDTITGSFGVGTDRPVSGDWNGDGRDGVGIWRPSTRELLLDANENNLWDGAAGGDTQTAAFGFSTDLPVTGRW